MNALFVLILISGILCFTIFCIMSFYKDKEVIDTTCRQLDEQIGYNKCLQDNVYPYQTYIETKLQTLSPKIPKFVNKRKPRYLKRR